MLSKLPVWLPDFLEDVPFLKLPNRPVTFKDFERIAAPVTVFSAGPTVGVHMRLKVEHVSVDSSYDRTRDARKSDVTMKNSSKKPFLLEVIAWPPRTNSDLWILTSNNNHRIEHRNAPFDLGYILGDNCYNCYGDVSLSENIIDTFIHTEKQDDLLPEFRQHLGWLLLRLLSKGHLEVREKRTDRLYHSFDDPPVGYWKISVDK